MGNKMLLRSTLLICLWNISMVDSDVHRRGPLRMQFPKAELPVAYNGVDPGQPLFLTPYIEKGQFEQAMKMSQVGPLKGTDVKSYSGYFTVNKQLNSNMFFWFFPAQTESTNAPVVLWLQGGPGGSSMFGLFVESGPFMLDDKIMLHPRKTTWNSKYSMLYIDNPVGTGFSFTNSSDGFAKNETDVARDLYSALTQFFQIFQEYQKNDFYATGESYAGKYVPAITYKIHIENPTAKVKINLRGMAIGDGLCDPETMFDYGEFMYQVGLASESQRDYIKSRTDMAVKYIQSGKFMEAFYVFDVLLNGDVVPYPSYFKNITGISNYYNYLQTVEPPSFEYFNKYFTDSDVRHSIHVGSLPFNAGDKVEKNLLNDIMRSVKPWITAIMDADYKVMIYNGQLDVIIAYPLTESFLRSVPWKGQQDYMKANRTIWKINPSDIEVSGYVRKVNNFYQVMVRGGGHILPYDQPERAFDMIDRFISGRGFKET